MVVTGFLGSGKTTLVNQLVRKQSDSLVVVNEFGEVPVDHHLLESPEERTVALPNGCLCCHLRGDLAGFDRVIVETSGLADPGPVAQTLFADQALARDFKLGAVLAVVDAADAGNRRLGGEVARAQIAAADVVVLSKIDRAGDLAEVEAEVGSINPLAARIPARFGDVDPAMLAARSGTNPVFPGAAVHAAGVRSFVLDFEAPVPQALLERFLALLVDLRGADLMRVKGLVTLETGRSVLVQGVRHVFDRLRPVPGAARTGLVFITHNVEQREVQALWQAMSNLKGSS